MTEPYLEISRIPKTLWESTSQTLILPQSLAKAYTSLIDKNNLRSLASARTSEDPPVGGLSQGETDKHFAQAFSGSAARVQLAVLNPKQDVTAASNAFIKILSGNHVTLVDAPCGAGAAALSFLTTIAELRTAGILPREPLDISLIGAEISAPARKYASDLIQDILPFLESEGIFVHTDFTSWDVTDKASNTQLIKKMTIAAGNNSRLLLIVANFNAFLFRFSSPKRSEKQLEELFRHASGTHSHNVAIWIEPDMNCVTNPEGGLFSWLSNLLENTWKSFARAIKTIGTPILQSSALFQNPLRPTEPPPTVRLAVMPIDLEWEK